MDPELWLQQCRIYQNKEKTAITLPYIDDDNFYMTLDKYVFDGYRIRINFPDAKIGKGSALLKRIISCVNGQLLIDNYKDIYNNLRNILAFTSQEDFIAAIIKYIDTDIKFYNTYLFRFDCNDAPEEKSVLCLEPAGGGLPSQSFTVDI